MLQHRETIANDLQAQLLQQVKQFCNFRLSDDATLIVISAPHLIAERATQPLSTQKELSYSGVQSMIDLSTKYLGLTLDTPLVVSASPLSQEIDGIRRLEDAGASAIVLYSLFEEQLRQEAMELEYHLSAGTESFAESLTYLPMRGEFHTGPEGYLEHIGKPKTQSHCRSSPVSTALRSVDGRIMRNRSKKRAQTAIECNIYSIPADMDVTGSEIEQRYVDILRAVKSAVRIPVAVKLGPFFSNMAHMAKQLEKAGADGLVLFNRFYQPDIDLDELEIRPNVLLSTPQALRLPLTWIGILYGRIRLSLAATSGIHSAEDVIKLLLLAPT